MISRGHFEFDQRDRFAVVDVNGDLDISNAHEFEAVLDRAAESNQPVIVSLERSSYFDSKGIQVLLRFAERMAGYGQRLSVVAPAGTSLRRILDIAGIPGAIPMFDSLDDAIAGGGQG